MNNRREKKIVPKNVRSYASSAYCGDHSVVVLGPELCRMTLDNIKPRRHSVGLRSLPYLMQRLQRRIELDEASSRRYALLTVDVNSFRRIIDSIGMVTAETVLAEVGRRLQQTVRCVGGSIASRLRGDRFVLLVDDLAGEEDALTYASFLRYLLGRPIHCGKQEICLSVSIGIAFGGVANYADSTQVIEDSGVAANRAKACGMAECVVFRKQMRDESADRLQLESDLRLAVEVNQFEIHYQPKFYIQTGTLKGFEALIRWNHPARGLVSPKEFIPVAEELGLISDIGRWVATEAIGQLMRWRRMDLVDAKTTMAINISTHQLQSSNLSEFLQRELAAAEVPADCLVLEVTESALLADSTNVITLLERLVAAGIGLDLDDFGTGYSSLSYLHRFPFRSIKIDQSFVRRMCDDGQSVRLVAAIVGLAHSLDMTVIAEGVETEQQAKCLEGMGCLVAQGYYFCPPLASRLLEAFLMRGERKPIGSAIPLRRAATGNSVLNESPAR